MGDFSVHDKECMKIAFEQAKLAATSDEVPVGAVLSLNNEIIAQDHNRTIVNHDPAAHAEVLVIRQAAEIQGNHRLANSTLYVTLEPCVMCVGVMIQARIERLVFAASDPKSGAVGSVMDLSSHPELNHAFSVEGGLMAEECAKLLRDFFKVRR
ncbi:tRNA adenosine(34) deaminase TadA [Woeseiaceae bacterium]|jgi:tRNA(adenine34) deaminase|nr:tRNA adenosine(34) deaminase TadA [Woeseiaceae bacterium]